jgi:hypothetical protein
MAHRPEDPNPTPPSATSSEKPDGERRRFIVAGLASAPLLVTLTARPASAWGDDHHSGSLGSYGSATPS